jgi:hypothetical protein
VLGLATRPNMPNKAMKSDEGQRKETTRHRHTFERQSKHLSHLAGYRALGLNRGRIRAGGKVYITQQSQAECGLAVTS